MDRVIGIDLDNTLAGYDDLVYEVGRQRGLIPAATGKSKKEIRDSIRRLPDGEIEWQKLQSIVYGRRMGEARLIDGVETFFGLCRKHNVRTYIVSHKTEYAHFDGARTNLRAAAFAWMAKNGFFDGDGLGLAPANVYFEPTRAAKIERIRQVKCTHFIDDLEETFLEASFPSVVEKILYAPHGTPIAAGGARSFVSWEEMSRYFFGEESADGIL